MFKGLLNATENRQLNLLNHLSSKKGWSFDSLSVELKCSVRTVKSDMSFLKTSLTDLFTIQTSENNRIHFDSLTPDAPFQAAMRIYKASVHVKFLRLLYEQDAIKKGSYEQKLHISASTLLRAVKQINDELSPYKIEITGKPYRLMGKERHIRYFFSLFYWTIYHKTVETSNLYILERSEQFIQKLKKMNIIDASPITVEKISYFFSVSLDCIERGFFMEEFTSPLFIPQDIREIMEKFLSQFYFVIPSSDVEMLLFYLCPFYVNQTQIVNQSDAPIQEKRNMFSEYLKELQRETDIQLYNNEELLNQITLQYVYKVVFEVVAFLIGPTLPENLLSSLGKKYYPFIKKAFHMIESNPILGSKLPKKERSAFIYWVITHWEGLTDQLDEKYGNKEIVLIMSELGHQQEAFLKSVLENRFGNRVAFILHSQRHARDKHNFERIEFVLTDTFSTIIESAAPEGTAIIPMDYSHFEESIRYLEKRVSKKTKKEESRFKAEPSFLSQDSLKFDKGPHS